MRLSFKFGALCALGLLVTIPMTGFGMMSNSKQNIFSRAWQALDGHKMALGTVLGATTVATVGCVLHKNIFGVNSRWIGLGLAAAGLLAHELLYKDDFNKDQFLFDSDASSWSKTHFGLYYRIKRGWQKLWGRIHPQKDSRISENKKSEDESAEQQGPQQGSITGPVAPSDPSITCHFFSDLSNYTPSSSSSSSSSSCFGSSSAACQWSAAPTLPTGLAPAPSMAVRGETGDESSLDGDMADDEKSPQTQQSLPLSERGFSVPVVCRAPLLA